MIKIAELFAGIGGFFSGFREEFGEENIELVFASEIDKFATQSYTAIYGHTPHGDITQIHETDIPDHDILVGGFPCQAFSVAGKRLGFEDTRGTLFFEVARIAKEKQPRMLLLENVKGLVTHDKGRTFEVIVQTLSEIGYRVDFEILNSKYFNVAQNRERIFIVAIREDLLDNENWNIDKSRNDTAMKTKKKMIDMDIKTFNFDFPSQTTVSSRLADILEEAVPENYYISEEKVRTLKLKEPKETPEISVIGKIEDMGNDRLARVHSTDGLSPTLLARSDNTNIAEIEPKIDIIGKIDIKAHEALKNVYSTDGLSPTIDTMQGGNRQPKIIEPSISDILEENVSEEFYLSELATERVTERLDGKECRVYNWYNDLTFQNDEAIGTLTSSSGSWTGKTGFVVIEPPNFRIRKLTPLECLRLQAFPDEYYHIMKSAGLSNSQIYKQAGNAVTVNVIKALANKLKPYLSEETND